MMTFADLVLKWSLIRSLPILISVTPLAKGFAVTALEGIYGPESHDDTNL